MTLITLILIVGVIILFTVGWFLYYLSFPYWERHGFWEKYTWIGFIVMCKRIKTMNEPGKTYAKIASYLIGYTPIIFIIVLILFKILNLL